MTVIRPNSISGITSITAQANEINVFRSDGTLAGLQLNGVNFNNTSGISTLAALNVTGNVSVGGTLTYQDVTNIDSVGIITARSTIDAQGDVSIADKIIHTGDTNTAIRFPAADTITAETAGAERFRIDSGGRIGIKNTSPSSQYFNNLVVGDNSSGDWGITIRTNSSNKGVIAFSDTDASDANRYDGYIAYHHNGQSMRFHTGGANERLRIAADGKIGINCTPLSQFQVKIGTNQNIAFNSSSSNSRISAYNDAANASVPLIINGADLRFTISDTEKLRINSSGQLIMTNAATQTFFDFSTTNNTTRGVISLAGKDGSGNAVTLKMGGFGDTSRGEIFTHSNHGLGFATNNAATQMMLDTSGRLLLGRTSASHSSSTMEIQGGAEAYLRISPNTNTGTSGVVFGTADDHSTGGIYYNGSDDSLVLAGHNNTERVRIDSNGMLHISDRNSANAGEHVFQAGSFGIRMQDTGGFNWWRLEANYGGYAQMIALRADRRIGIYAGNPTSRIDIGYDSNQNGNAVMQLSLIHI